jgi:phage terminase large subunit-like protein
MSRLNNLKLAEIQNKSAHFKPYPKQLEFYTAGKDFVQRAFLAGNRVGKTYSGAMELSYHLTGRYPDWWPGLRFDHPINAWAISVTTQATRDVLQYAYLGDISTAEPNSVGGSLALGCGTIPKDAIIDIARARGGVNDAVDVVKVKHVSGGVSNLGFKSYDQGRTKFQGTARHFIHLDEEPSQDIYNECVMRLVGEGVKGKLILTMTPLLGMTDVCLKFIQNTDGFFHYTQASWNDAPHISDQDKQELLSGMMPHEREAREKGIPAIGAGRVYTTPEADFVVDPFKLPNHWKYSYGMDFGWHNTAAAFTAYDPDTDIVYVYDEYKQGEKEPVYHASVLKAKGAKWMPGVCDPAGGSSNQKDGESLMDMYAGEGLNLSAANNGVDSGIMQVYQRLVTGRLKVFSNCSGLIAEYRTYARNADGKIIKKNDHVLDALRYAIVSGLSMARVKPAEKRSDYSFFDKIKQVSPWAL